MAAPIDTHFQSTSSSEKPFDSNWLRQHPKFLEMSSYGFDNDDQHILAMLTLMDLMEAKHWWHVRIHPCEKLKSILICGQATQSTEIQIIIPRSARDALSMADIQELISAAKIPGILTDGLTVALVDADSTISYFKFTSGLVPPETPSMMEVKKRRHQRKFRRRRAQVNALQEKISEIHKQSND